LDLFELMMNFLLQIGPNEGIFATLANKPEPTADGRKRMRDLRPDELNHVYGGTAATGKRTDRKTDKHTDRRTDKKTDRKKS
jgi:hypothetical protein